MAKKEHWITQTKLRLRADEGFRARAYRDSRGYLTIGYGRLIEASGGITVPEANYLLANDIRQACADLDRVLPWWRSMSPARQGALVMMCFNLGLQGLLGFKAMLAEMSRGDWEAAAREMLDSRWASQVGARATRLADQVRLDRWF